MKKFLLLACLAASSVWAATPQYTLRAYQRPQGGYVMVDPNNEPVIISETGNVKNISKGLLQYLEDAEIAVQIMSEENISQVNEEDFNEPVGPILGDIEFNQFPPYNMYAPTVNEEQCVTGCVATAMAQIMTYWKYPTVCTDTVIKYTTATLNYPITYDYKDIVFNWDNIIPKYDGVESTDEQQQEVAKLMKACGVSVHMNYNTSANGGSGSGSNKVVDALTHVFNYKKGLRFETKDKDLSYIEFVNALVEEFDAGRPVYCSGVTKSEDGGHAFVIDGYRTQKGKEGDNRFTYFHFNWGWGGTGNNWVRINTETPYSNQMTIIRKIIPMNATALNDIEQAGKNDGKIYDILGREVKQMISGRIYIQDGKKFIAR